MAKITHLDDFLSYGVDSAKRRIYFGDLLDNASEDLSEFSHQSVELAIRCLHRLVAEGPNKPIELHMNSHGGDPYAMLRLYDEILSCSCQVKFFGGGVIQSSATWIMAVCDERYLYPNTTVMVHDGSDDFVGNHTDGQIYMAEGKRLQDLLYDIYAANSRMPRVFWEEVCQRDLFLTAEETIKLGLADKIVEPKKRGNLRKMRQTSLKKSLDQADMQKLLQNLYARVNRFSVPKLELNKPVKEAEDPTLKIDDTPPSVPSENDNPAMNLLLTQSHKTT